MAICLPRKPAHTRVYLIVYLVLSAFLIYECVKIERKWRSGTLRVDDSNNHENEVDSGQRMTSGHPHGVEWNAFEESWWKALKRSCDIQSNVAIIFATEATLLILLNLIESVIRVQMHNCLVVAFDQVVYQTVLRQYPEINVYFNDLGVSEEVSKWSDPATYRYVMLQKTLLTKKALEMKVNVLSLDTDLIFFQNVFSAIAFDQYDIITQGVECQDLQHCMQMLCGGFFYMRSHPETINILAQASECLKTGKEFHQTCLNKALKAIDVENSLKMKVLPLDLMPFGDEYFHSCFNFARTNQTIGLHASTHTNHSSCVNVKQWREEEKTIRGKIEGLKRHGLFTSQFQVRCFLF